jgi:hypothetical protein
MSHKNHHAIQQVTLHNKMWGVWCGLNAVDELQKVSHNLFMGGEACLQAEGGQFQHLL